MICKRVYYSGRVQGVGFRYTACSVAAGFKVHGFVRNLANGNVEVLAEGDEAEVGSFLAALGNRMADYIRGCTEQDEEPQGFQDFSIRY